MLKKIIDKNWEFPFLYSVPDDIKDDEKLPLIVFLHGAGERGNDLVKVCDQGLPKYFLNNKEERAILLCPQCEERKVWKMQVEKLYSFINRFIIELPVDKKAVSMSGISMGAYGTYDFAMTYPEMLSAIACVCGAGDCWRAELIKDIPIRIFHGDKDDIVPVSNSYELYDAIKRSGGTVDLTIFHDVGHNSWDLAYGTSDVINWLLMQKIKF